MSRAALVALTLAACGGPGPCEPGGPEIVAAQGAESLSCADAEHVAAYARRVAGRSMHPADRAAMIADLGEAFAEEPAATRARVAAAHDFVADLDQRVGVDAAERRATEGYAVAAGTSAVTGGREVLGTLTTRAMSVWVKDDAERLVLTEADIEGWTRFASLCREVQGAPPLKVSIADRVSIYNEVMAAFKRSPRAGKVGLVALGGAWPALEVRWPSVSYEQQQKWTLAAPFPPPMEATSLAYVEALAATDPAGMAAALFAGVGDLPQTPAD